MLTVLHVESKYKFLQKIQDSFPCTYMHVQVSTSYFKMLKHVSLYNKQFPIQGRSQDFSVGTHSFPSHLFTPPPPKKRSKSFSIHVSFISNRVRKSLN